MTKKRRNILVVAAIVAVALVMVLFKDGRLGPIDYSGPTADWLDYGNSRGGDRYSPLTQITPENVRHLEIAWVHRTGDVSDGRGDVHSTTAFEATPILVNGTLFVCSPFNRVIALDPETGAERWSYEPWVALYGVYANRLVCRGVTTWLDADLEDGACHWRIFTATNDARLIALDAATGVPCEDFGEGGQVDLNPGVGEQLWPGEYQVTSPPAVAGNIVIVGSAVADNVRTDAPSGVVRAYDARTGELVWGWDLAPPFDIPNAQYAAETGYMLSTPNVWAPFAVDEERDMVFLPTGNPTPDYYGGHRNGIEFPSVSVVALRAVHRRSALALPDRASRSLGFRRARAADVDDDRSGRG